MPLPTNQIDAISLQAVFAIVTKAEDSISAIMGKRVSLIPHTQAQSTDDTKAAITQKDFQLRAIISNVTGISWKDMASKSRKKEIVTARFMYCVYARALTGLSLKSIGLNLGGRDHTTVLNALQTVKDLLDTRDVVVTDMMTKINEHLISLNQKPVNEIKTK